MSDNDNDPDASKKKPGAIPSAVEPGDVLTNAFRRLDNRFRGVPNDASLIGEDLPEEDEDEEDGNEDDWDDDPDRDANR